MQKISFSLALLAWLGMLCVTDHYLPWVSWHGEVMACVALFFLWLSSVFQRQNFSQVPIPSIALILFSVVAAVVVQAAFQKLLFPSEIFLIIIHAALIILSISLGSQYGRGHSYRGINAFATVMLATALILAVQAMVRAFDLDLFSEWIGGIGAKRRPGSNLSQPNHLATFLNWGIVSLAYLSSGRKIRPVYFYMAALPLIFGLVLTESRTGFLAFSCLIVLYFLSIPKGAPNSYGILGLWAIACLLFVWWPEAWAYIQKIDGTGHVINTSSSGRIELWREALRAIAIHPLSGWGYRQFAWAHMSTFETMDAAIVATYSHNLILDLLIWFGVPFGLFLIAWMVRWLFLQVLCARTPEQKYGLCFLMPFGLHAMFEYPYMFLYFLIPVGLCIGSLSSLNGEVPKFKLTHKMFNGLYAIIFALAAWSVFEYFLLEEDFRLARFASARVGSDPIDYRRANAYLLPQVADLVSVVRENPREAMDEVDIARARRVALYYPWLGTLSKYALILKLNGREEEYLHVTHIMRVYFGEGSLLRLREKLELLRASEVSQ